MLKTSNLKSVALLITSILLSHTAHAQARDVPVSFREDGVKKNLAYRIKLTVKGEETEPAYSEEGFIIPSDLKAEKVRVKIAFCDKVIDFGEVYRELFETEWVVGIDNKPYEQANVGHLPGPMRDQGNVLYYIEFMNGRFIKYKMTVFK